MKKNSIVVMAAFVASLVSVSLFASPVCTRCRPAVSVGVQVGRPYIVARPVVYARPCCMPCYAPCIQYAPVWYSRPHVGFSVGSGPFNFSFCS